MAIYPLIADATQDITAIQDRGINFLFDFNQNDFILKDGKLIELFGDAAVVFWIEKTLRTEFEEGAVYENTEYGTRLKEYRGRIFPREIEKTIFENNIKSALLKHERIAEIANFTFSHIGDNVEISFEVELEALTDVEQGPETTDEGFTKLSTLEEIKDFLGIKLLTSNRFFFKTSAGNQVFIRF